MCVNWRDVYLNAMRVYLSANRQDSKLNSILVTLFYSQKVEHFSQWRSIRQNSCNLRQITYARPLYHISFKKVTLIQE